MKKPAQKIEGFLNFFVSFEFWKVLVKKLLLSFLLFFWVIFKYLYDRSKVLSIFCKTLDASNDFEEITVIDSVGNLLHRFSHFIRAFWALLLLSVFGFVCKLLPGCVPQNEQHVLLFC